MTDGIMVWFMASKEIEDKNASFTLKQEILRKSFHSSVFLLVIAPFLLDVMLIKFLLFSSLVVAVIIEMYRWKNPSTWINFLTRKEERTGVANYPFTLLTWFVVALPAEFWYPYVVVTLSTIPTLLGDAVAAVIGRSMGRHKLPLARKKTVEGTIAGFISAFLLAVGLLWLEKESNMLLAVFPAVIFFLMDFLEDLPPWFSDNMLSALITALGLKLVFFLK